MRENAYRTLDKLPLMDIKVARAKVEFITSNLYGRRPKVWNLADIFSFGGNISPPQRLVAAKSSGIHGVEALSDDPQDATEIRNPRPGDARCRGTRVG
jgi:hypothetical protein